MILISISILYVLYRRIFKAAERRWNFQNPFIRMFNDAFQSNGEIPSRTQESNRNPNANSSTRTPRNIQNPFTRIFNNLFASSGVSSQAFDQNPHGNSRKKSNNGWFTNFFGNFFDPKRSTVSWNQTDAELVVGNEVVVTVKVCHFFFFFFFFFIFRKTKIT